VISVTTQVVRNEPFQPGFDRPQALGGGLVRWILQHRAHIGGNFRGRQFALRLEVTARRLIQRDRKIVRAELGQSRAEPCYRIVLGGS